MSAAPDRGIIDPQITTRLLNTFGERQRCGELLYRALGIEAWFECFVDGNRQRLHPRQEALQPL